MKYSFTRDVRVEDADYRLGDTIAQGDIPAGCFSSLVGVGWLVVADTPTAPAAGDGSAEESPQPKTKRRTTRKPAQGK